MHFQAHPPAAQAAPGVTSAAGGGAVAPAPTIRRGSFADVPLEAAFRDAQWPDWSRRVRVTALVAAGVLLALGAADYLNLGLVPQFGLCLALRLLVLLSALRIAALSRSPADR